MRLNELKEVVASQVGDACELVGLLELTIEDVMDRFPDVLLDMKDKFGVIDEDE